MTKINKNQKLKKFLFDINDGSDSWLIYIVIAKSEEEALEEIRKDNRKTRDLCDDDTTDADYKYTVEIYETKYAIPTVNYGIFDWKRPDEKDKWIEEMLAE